MRFIFSWVMDQLGYMPKINVDVGTVEPVVAPKKKPTVKKATTRKVTPKKVK